MTDVDSTPSLSTQPAEPDPTPTALSAAELGRWAWRQLTSMRTALILLMLLGLAAVPGSLIPQERVDPNAVANWQAAHPGLTPLYRKLELFQVYGSVWFSAIYLLLMVSLVGCIVPRIRVYWRAARAKPPRAPRNLLRLPSSTSAISTTPAQDIAARAADLLRRARYRVDTTVEPDEDGFAVAAQRGYLREVGNLLFHISVVVVLVAFASGDMFGYRGTVNVVAGQTFTNTREAYDDYAPGTLFSDGRLAPFSLTLNDFKVGYLTAGPDLGQPTTFRADLSYRQTDGTTRSTPLQVNHPLSIDGTDVFLVGNGYAPVITVRDGSGKVAYSGPTVFLPTSSTYASFGVIKVPDASPTQLGFEGQFLPTYASAAGVGPYSAFPDALAPALSLNLYTGDLGLGSGVPQSVYALNKSHLTEARGRDGKPLTLTIRLGQTRTLPGGAGSISFDGVRRYARLQIASTPASPLALFAVVLALFGLIGSLYVRPRRIWVRAKSTESGTEIHVAGLDQREGPGRRTALAKFVNDLTQDLTKERP